MSSGVAPLCESCAHCIYTASELLGINGNFWRYRGACELDNAIHYEVDYGKDEEYKTYPTPNVINCNKYENKFT